MSLAYHRKTGFFPARSTVQNIISHINASDTCFHGILHCTHHTEETRIWTSYISCAKYEKVTIYRKSFTKTSSVRIEYRWTPLIIAMLLYKLTERRPITSYSCFGIEAGRYHDYILETRNLDKKPSDAWSMAIMIRDDMLSYFHSWN